MNIRRVYTRSKSPLVDVMASIKTGLPLMLPEHVQKTQSSAPPVLSHCVLPAYTSWHTLPPKVARTCSELKFRYNLGMFEVKRTIGCGAFSTVKLAKDVSTDEPVALKVMSKEKLIKSKQVSHVRNEKACLELMNSPFIIQLHAAFQDQTGLYMALEYCPGGELFSRLQEIQCLDKKPAQFYAAEILCALRQIHTFSYVYRDLKPENVMISITGHVKLADFGFAKQLMDGTKSYTLCGSAHSLAPEVIQRTGHSFHYDMWQLGILLFEMMAGEVPFDDEEPYKLYEKVLSEEADLEKVEDREAQDLTRRLLCKDPNNRLTLKEAMQHPFFQELAWEDVECLRLPAPWLPEVSNPFDDTYFEEYAELPSPTGAYRHDDLFPDF